MTRDEILGTRRYHTVTAGGVSVRVRLWGGRERLAFDNEVSARRKPDRTIDVSTMLAPVFALSVVGDDGKPLFSVEESQLIEDSVVWELLEAVSDWAMEANGLLKAGQDAAVKN
jgi:hypothetical protein